MKFDKLVLLSVALCAIVLAGEFMAYGPSMHSYGADARIENGSVDISIRSSGSDTYSAMIVDNGARPAVTQLYVYMDNRYDRYFGDAEKTVSMNKLDLPYSIDQVCRTLNVRGFDRISVLNDEQLFDAMNGDMGGYVSKGLLVMSYALPDSIYSGTADDLLLKWIGLGGYLYWMSSPIGMFCYDGSGLAPVNGSQELLFGKECMNLGETDIAYSVTDCGGLTKALALKWNRVRHALDPSDIDGALSMGFSEDGYSSISMVPFGSGMICVLGGNYERQQCDDAAQIIASGISCYSKILWIGEGSITRETIELRQEIPPDAGNISVYISIGGYYVTYGRLIQC